MVVEGIVITLIANVTFSDSKGVCPVRAPVEFICHGTNVASFTWKRNNTAIRTLTSQSQLTDRLQETEFNGIQVQLVSVIITDHTEDRVNLTSRLVVDPSVLSFGDQISCVSSTGVETLTYTQKGKLYTTALCKFHPIARSTAYNNSTVKCFQLHHQWCPSWVISVKKLETL